MLEFDYGFHLTAGLHHIIHPIGGRQQIANIENVMQWCRDGFETKYDHVINA